MKKFLLVAACFALTLSSCIKDGASEAVNSIYVSTAEKIQAEARLLDAQAAALKLLSEADAALKAAEVAAKEIQNQILDIERQLKEVELEAAKAELELLLAELEAQKAEIAADMEAAALAAEKALIEAEKALLEAQAAYAATLEDLEAAKAAKLIALYNKYADLTSEVLAAKAELTLAQIDLASAEQDLVDVQAAKEAQIAEADEVIATMNRLIAYEESKKAIIEQYQEVSLDEVQAELDAANIEYMTLEADFYAKMDEANALAEAMDALDIINHEFISYLNSDPLGLFDRFGDEVELPYVDMQYDENNIPWVGFYVEDEDPYTTTSEWDHAAGMIFIPAYTYYGTQVDGSNFVEYTLEGDLFPSREYYEQIISLGQYNPEAFTKYYEIYYASAREYFETAIAQYEEYKVLYTAQIPVLKGFADAAQVLAEAYDNWQYLVLDTTVESYMDYVTYQPVYTTYGKYLQASQVVNGYEDWYAGWVDGTEAKLEAADKAVKDAEAAVEDAETPEAKAAAEEDLAWAKKYYDLAKAADVAAQAELEAATKALEDQKKLVAPAEKAFYDARREYEYYYAANKASIELDYIYVETGGAVVFHEADGYENVDYTATYEFIVGRVAMAVENVDYCEYEIANYQMYLDVYYNGQPYAEECLAKLEVLAADAEEAIAEYNAAAKLYAELTAELYVAADELELKGAEVDALYSVLAGVEVILEALEDCDANIAGYEANIAEWEAIKADMYNVNSAEELVEVLNTIVELAEAKVAMYEALAKNAQAAWEAACEE